MIRPGAACQLQVFKTSCPNTVLIRTSILAIFASGYRRETSQSSSSSAIIRTGVYQSSSHQVTDEKPLNHPPTLPLFAQVYQPASHQVTDRKPLNRPPTLFLFVQLYQSFYHQVTNRKLLNSPPTLTLFAPVYANQSHIRLQTVNFSICLARCVLFNCPSAKFE